MRRVPRHLDALRDKDPEVFAGRFQIEGEGGIGGVSIVYRARDRLSGETVALKLLRKSDWAALRRFDTEAEALEKVHHPAIVRHIAHGLGEGGQRFLAMEWVEGETLGARLRRGPLGVAEVVRLGRRIADALTAAHAVGLLHRDVKPSNVLLPNKDIDQAKLADFGLARPTAPESAEEVHATATGIIVGTPGYMAPEQAHGVPDLDGRADLFSLGCLLFRCLTDVEAFGGSRALTALA
ncbi:MAG TPA: serine/threonine-protein kinase, partial [Polyangiaceae bacterium]|nr:serine/threonine-protein kinase [Polyangiaceae bacterium]